MLKDNNDCYSSVQNDESLHMDTVQMREESESGQESEKRCDLRWQQKMEREGAAVTCDGRLFHRRAAAKGNASVHLLNTGHITVSFHDVRGRPRLRFSSKKEKVRKGKVQRSQNRHISRICRKVPQRTDSSQIWHVEGGGGRNHTSQFWCL